MNQTIDGKRYNTETATLVAKYDNGLGYNDLDFVREELYRKRTGEYFLYGEGGARSIYSGMDYDLQCSGCKIVPLTAEQANEWIEEHDK